MPIRWWVEANPTPQLAALTADPDSVLGGPGSFAREQAGRKRFYRLPGAGGAPGIFVKVFTLAPGFDRLRYLLRPSKARREAQIARDVVARGFEAAVPLAVGEERRFGLLVRSFSVIQELPAPDLRRVLRDADLGFADRRAMLRRFGAFSRRLHDAGIDQDDYSTNNFLVLPSGDFVLIDFERCSVGNRPLGERGITLLAKLARREPSLSRSDHLRFLHAYLGPVDRAEIREVCTQIREQFLKIRRRDARRAAQAAFKAGRHLSHEGEVWTVRERADAKTLRLELPRERAREAWTRAFQMERLDLPALRPVRLDESGVELAEHETIETTGDAAIARARRAFELLGDFETKPEWRLTKDGAYLANPLSFRIDA